jgi:peptide/nickel transport system substrate-binding protein
MNPTKARRGAITALSAAAAIALTLSGCSASNNTQTSTGSDIVVGYGDVDNLDPAQFKSNTAATVTGNVYGTLVTQDYEEVDGYLRGTDSYSMSLADSIEYNADGTLLTIKLKPDLTFSDDSALTADDVAYTLQRSLSDVGYTGVFADYLNIAAPQTDITVADPTTVEIVTTAESPLLDKFLSFQSFGIISKAAGEANSSEEWAPDYFAKNVIASGPYEVASWTPGTSIVLQKNPNFTVADTSSSPETVTLQNTPSAEQSYLALQNKSIDIAMGLPPALAQQAQDNADLAVYNTVSSDLVYMGMNMDDPALQDLKVRQAISYAIPYDALREQVMKGFAGPAYGPAPYPMASALDTDGTKVAYPTDPAKAKELLTEAGVSNLNLKLSVPASDASSTETATFIQSALGEAGITVSIDQLTDADYNTALADGTTQLFLYNWYSWGEDAIYQMNFLLKTGAFTNYAHYSNPELDQALADGMAQSDAATRDQFSQTAQQIAIDDAPWAFLYTRDMIIVAQSDVHGITRPDDQFPRFQYITVV